MISLSIITVVYNGEESLQGTLDSILKYSNLEGVEHILIDGASNDETINVYKKHPILESKIKCKFITERDSGIYDAMNKGINLATGELIWFINSGDLLITPLEMNSLETRENAIYVFPYIEVKGLRKKIRKNLYKYELYHFLVFKMLNHQSIIYSRDVFSRIGTFSLNYSLASDHDHFLQCILRGVEIINVRKVLVEYCLDGVSACNRSILLDERFQIIEERLSGYRKWMAFISNTRRKYQLILKRCL